MLFRGISETPFIRLSFHHFIVSIPASQTYAKDGMQVPWSEWLVCNEDLLEVAASIPEHWRHSNAKVQQSALSYRPL